MEHDLVLEGKVVTLDGIVETEVGVSEGLVAEMRHGLKGARRISAERCLIFPGFVDLHVHLREPGWEHKEDFRSGTLAAVHGGVTTVVDMPNNPTPTITKESLDFKRLLADEKAVIEVKFNALVTNENLARLSELSDGVVGYKVYLSETTGAIVFPERNLPPAFGAISKTGKPVNLHCEDQTVIDKRKVEMQGVASPDLHCDLRPPEAELESVRKVAEAMRGVEELRGNVCHASAHGTLSIIRSARAEGVRLHCEGALHHLYYNRGAMLKNRLLKMNPPLRSEEDRQALVNGLKDGSVSFLVTDHAPHTEEEKDTEDPAGVPGLDDFSHVVSWLIRAQGVDPVDIAKVAASNPARHLHLDDRGETRVGGRADFAVLDLHSPEKVRNESVRSKCGWSAYEGREFPGRARWTVFGGEVLLDDYEMVI